MTVAAVLVAYAAGLGILGPRMLGRAKWTARAPLLAIVTYLAAGWSVVAALGLAVIAVAAAATGMIVGVRGRRGRVESGAAPTDEAFAEAGLPAGVGACFARLDGR